MTQETEEKQLKLKKLTIFTTIGIVTLWTLSYIVFYVFELFDDPNNIGDSFGAINSLFSGLALAGIILTILMQKQELEYQRKELVMTREEMVRTRKEFETQNSTLSKQQFENTFFQMINLLTTITEQSKYVRNQYTSTGRDAFKSMLNQYNEIIASHIRSENNRIGSMEIMENPNLEFTSDNINKRLSVQIYSTLFNYHKNTLSHYFRTLYHIVKLIDSTEGIDQRFYISVLRSQLSNPEQILLFYNCLHSNGLRFFKPLIEKHCLLKNIDFSMLANENLKLEYAEGAFSRT